MTVEVVCLLCRYAWVGGVCGGATLFVFQAIVSALDVCALDLLVHTCNVLPGSPWRVCGVSEKGCRINLKV